MDNQVKAGKTYDVFHTRKGKARVKVTDFCDPWIACVVISGHFQGIGHGSYRGPGETLEIRDELATFTAVE